MLFSLFVILFISFLSIKYKLYKRRLMKYVKHLPTLSGYPLIGSGHMFIGKNTKEIYQILLDISKIETPAATWLGPKLHIVIGRREDMQTVLLSPHCLDKPYVYRFLPNDRGLFTSEVHIWKPNRKLLNPSFNVKMLTSFIPIFNEKSKLLVEKLNRIPDNHSVDASKFIFAFTLDIICATSLGYDPEIQGDKNKEFLESMERLLQSVANRIVKIWLHPSWIYKMTPSYQIEKRLFRRISSLTAMIKDVKHSEYDDKNKDSITNEITDDEYSTPQIFINELFKLSRAGKISDEDITEQVNTMIVGGNETSALILSHTVLMVAIHPECQAKVFAEHDHIRNLLDSEITFNSISQLPYMDMVIKEVMRLFPIRLLLARNCLADTKISNCTIPGGTFVIMSVHNLHRNPKYWGEHPNEFDQDTFLPKRIAGIHPYSYLPFSGGMRICIGMKYAWISMKVLLVNLLLNFKFSIKLKMEELTLRWDLTLKIDNKQLFTVEKRI